MLMTQNKHIRNYSQVELLKNLTSNFPRMRKGVMVTVVCRIASNNQHDDRRAVQ